MSSAVVAALVTGGFALLVALYSAGSSYRRERRLRELGFGYDTRLETRKSELSRADAADRARREYEYSARLSLYQGFEPVLFQLMDLADYALDRIRNLTEPSVWPKFALAEPSRAHSGRPPMAEAEYEIISTLYGLFAPLVLVRSMSRQLTLVDLSLEPRIEFPYYLASRIYSSFRDDIKLAAMHPQLGYDPFHPEWRKRRERDPARYWWQGLTMGRLENVLDLLSTAGSDPDSLRLIVSIRKCCERAFRWPAWRSSSAAPVMALRVRVLIRAGAAGPRRGGPRGWPSRAGTVPAPSR